MYHIKIIKINQMLFVCVSYALIWYCELFKEKVYVIDHGISFNSLFLIFMPRSIYIYENMKYKY